MAKRLERTTEDELRTEYDLDELGPGVRGKYYRQAKAGTNLVLIEPDLAKVFPDQESVNRALRLLVTPASDATRAARRARIGPSRRTVPNQRPTGRHSGQ